MQSTPVAAAGVLLLTAAVGALDLLTGTELRVPTLYLLPLLLAGWRLGRRVALLTALLATATWLATLHANGLQMSRPSLWVANGITAGLGFGLVGWLVASLHDALARERGLGRTDPLTGLANRRALVDQAQALAEQVCSAIDGDPEFRAAGVTSRIGLARIFQPTP